MSEQLLWGPICVIVVALGLWTWIHAKRHPGGVWGVAAMPASRWKVWKRWARGTPAAMPGSSVLWTIVGVLAAIALIVWLIPHIR